MDAIFNNEVNKFRDISKELKKRNHQDSQNQLSSFPLF